MFYVYGIKGEKNVKVKCRTVEWAAFWRAKLQEYGYREVVISETELTDGITYEWSGYDLPKNLKEVFDAEQFVLFKRPSYNN